MAVPSTQRRMGALLADGYLRMAHTPLSLDRSHCIMSRGACQAFFVRFHRERLKIQILEILKDILRKSKIERDYSKFCPFSEIFCICTDFAFRLIYSP